MSEVVERASVRHQERIRARYRAAILSLVAAVVIFGAKFVAFRMTNSAAILSDALESIVNIVAAGMAAFSVWYAAQPADEEHPYGHGKVEDFSAGVEGALIVLAALGILYSAIPRFFRPEPIHDLDVGVTLVIGAGIANLLLGLYLIRQGRRQHSRALEADGKHVLADVVTSVGAVLGLLAVLVTDWLWLDPAIACLFAIHILVSGTKLIRESVGRLMDEADEEALDLLAEHLQSIRRPHWVDIHELRAWWSGDTLHVDAHLALPRYWSIERSHAEADALEEEVAKAVGKRSGVVVHVDPCREAWCRLCAVEDCPVRAHEHATQVPWDRAHLVRLVPED